MWCVVCLGPVGRSGGWGYGGPGGGWCRLAFCVVLSLLVVVLSVVACGRGLWSCGRSAWSRLVSVVCGSRSARCSAVRALCLRLCVGRSRMAGVVGVAVPRVGAGVGCDGVPCVLWGWVLIQCRGGVECPCVAGVFPALGTDRFGFVGLVGTGVHGCGAPRVDPLVWPFAWPPCAARVVVSVRVSRLGRGGCRPRWGCPRPPCCRVPPGHEKAPALGGRGGVGAMGSAYRVHEFFCWLFCQLRMNDWLPNSLDRSEIGSLSLLM